MISPLFQPCPVAGSVSVLVVPHLVQLYVFSPSCVHVRAVVILASKKFAGDLGHRDFLGSLMALGIKRQLLGDIQIVEGVGYLFCLEEIAPYLCENLISVGRTTVRCESCDPPEQLCQPPEPTEVVVASERLDALIAAVWKLSRNQAQELLERGMVFIDGRLVESASHTLREGDVVSVRHQGRFRYEGTLRETKKGRV